MFNLFFHITCQIYSLTISSLENALRSFACLTVEDLIEFKYNDKVIAFDLWLNTTF